MMNGTAQEFQNMVNQTNKMMMDSWSSWTKSTIQSESFATASGAMMDWSLATHKMMTELQGQVMESLDIPKRSDLARISSQVQSVETRLLEQEDAQEDIKDMLLAIVNKLDRLEKQGEASAKAAPVVETAAEVKSEAETATSEAPAAKKPAAKKSAAKSKKTARKSKAKKASK